MTTLGIDVGKKNLGLCLVHKKAIVDWAVMSFRGPTAKDVFAGITGSPIFKQAIGRCVIEKQPPKNPTMCRIQHYLEFWCASQGIPVKVQDARVKLSYARGLPTWDHRFDTSTYYQRKRTAIKVVEGLLDDKWLRFYRTHAKRDDLADSFLHALAYDGALFDGQDATIEEQRPTIDFDGVAARKPGARTAALKKSHVKWLVTRGQDHPDLTDAIARYFKK